MHQGRNFKLNYPIEMVFSVTNRTEADKGVSATESLLLLKGRVISQSSNFRFLNGILRSMHFQDQPKMNLSFETEQYCTYDTVYAIG